jgi:hypothetical protein
MNGNIFKGTGPWPGGTFGFQSNLELHKYRVKSVAVQILTDRLRGTFV